MTDTYSHLIYVASKKKNFVSSELESNINLNFSSTFAVIDEWKRLGWDAFYIFAYWLDADFLDDVERFVESDIEIGPWSMTPLETYEASVVFSALDPKDLLVLKMFFSR